MFKIDVRNLDAVCRVIIHMGIFAVTTASGKERDAADAISTEGGSAVHSVLAPHTLNGYVFVEGETREAIENAVSRTPYTQKVVQGETSLEEVEQFLTVSSDVASVTAGEEVFITNGAYEGKKAQITRVNEADEKVTVELLNEPIQIPIELPGSQVRPA